MCTLQFTFIFSDIMSTILIDPALFIKLLFLELLLRFPPVFFIESLATMGLQFLPNIENFQVLSPQIFFFHLLSFLRLQFHGCYIVDVFPQVTEDLIIFFNLK